MLLLDRRISNSILIGDDIEIVVAGFYEDANGQQVVKLGINAPKHISIDRKEVRERRIQNVNRIVNSGIPKK